MPKIASIASLLLHAFASAWVRPTGTLAFSPGSLRPLPSPPSSSLSASVASPAKTGGRELIGSRSHETDVVVVGSGLAGLSCAALLVAAGKSVTVVESHDAFGGCAHGWERRGFHFESGPSLYSGFSTEESPNPLKGIFQIVGEEPEWITYDRWGTVLPDGRKFAAKIGPEEFGDVLDEFGDEGAREEFEGLMERMKPLSDAAQSLTSLAIREDPGAVVTLGLRYPKELLQTLAAGQELNDPFQNIMEETEMKSTFVKNWLDMLCFLLQGLPASGTMNAVIAYMLADWYRPGVTLDFPRGGSGAIADALLRGVLKGTGAAEGRAYSDAPVEEILVDDAKRACGVRLKGGDVVRAREAVVSNADPTVTRRLLAAAKAQGRTSRELDACLDRMADGGTGETEGAIPDLASFIHLHAGIDATDLPPVPSADFPAQWAVIRDWDREGGVEAPRNIVLCSMPSLIDPSLAPEGKHVLHAYVPATEPYADWAGMDRNSEEYKAKKEEAADFLWSAIEEYVPNARERAVKGTVQIGTPLTHERFLRRSRGAYGPRVVAGENTLPGHKTPMEGLLLCGDYTFPGIGVPATAASGAIAANCLIPVWKHWNLLDRIKLPKK